MNKYVFPYFLVLGFAACGGTDLEPGTAEIEGQVAGHGIAPQTAFLALHPLVPFQVLVMSEDAGIDCDSLIEAPERPVMVIGFPCGDPRVATYTLDVSDDSDCLPDTDVWMAVEGIPESTEYQPRAGTVTITERDSAVITGSFTADFGADGALSGEFSARICPLPNGG